MNLLPRKLVSTSISSSAARRRMSTPRILIAVIAIMIAVSAIFLEAPMHLTYADGSGEVCIFQAPSGAPIPGGYAGHIGWALLNTDPGEGPVGDWIYGAMEGPGLPSTFQGDPQNGNWYQEGDWGTMQSDFEYGMNSNSNVELFPADYYTKFLCMNTSDSNVLAAGQTFESADAAPYSLVSNNCEIVATEILGAYSADAASVFQEASQNLYNATPNVLFGYLATIGFGPMAAVGSADPTP